MALIFDEEQVKEILIKELGYKETLARDVVKLILINMDEYFQSALDQWLEDRTIPEDLEVKGVTYKMIEENLNSDFIGTLLRLDTALRKPGAAESLLDYFEREGFQ
ncbi:hypothetical protein [Hazenella coriacea]|uniref:Uncharacterized protein n=1 Tax=Hazenella coriacea TaxID=1179467 RepID=A0A4R3L5A1_9BACL|nr:hypothetical protein [Hazenella coriacea]TCS94863.1 hypothetical protein EDD58_103286 [Hazenella coriacea]